MAGNIGPTREVLQTDSLSHDHITKKKRLSCFERAAFFVIFPDRNLSIMIAFPSTIQKTIQWDDLRADNIFVA